MQFEKALKTIIQSHFVSQKSNKAYYSEASVQHKIAIEIYKLLRIESILEKKIKGKKEYLDILCKRGNIRYGIELKYKTKKVESRSFEYTTQSAQNNGKYDFLRDVARIESYVSSKILNTGFIVFITNDKRYFNPAREKTKIKKFDLINCLKKNYKPSWEGRNAMVKLQRKYPIKWQPDKRTDDENNVAYFRYCILKVPRQA